jgi:hypothetical protein
MCFFIPRWGEDIELMDLWNSLVLGGKSWKTPSLDFGLRNIETPFHSQWKQNYIPLALDSHGAVYVHVFPQSPLILGGAQLQNDV